MICSIINLDKIHKMSDFGLALFSTPGIYNCTDQNWQIKLDDVTININNVLFTAFNTDENLDSRTGNAINIDFPVSILSFHLSGRHFLFLNNWKNKEKYTV